MRDSAWQRLGLDLIFVTGIRVNIDTECRRDEQPNDAILYLVAMDPWNSAVAAAASHRMESRLGVA